MENIPVSKSTNEKLQSALKKGNEMLDKASISHEEKVNFVSELVMEMASLSPDKVEIMARDDSLEKFILSLVEKKIGTL